jgi:hypothetical protein
LKKFNVSRPQLMVITGPIRIGPKPNRLRPSSSGSPPETLSSRKANGRGQGRAGFGATRVLEIAAEKRFVWVIRMDNGLQN